MKNKITSIANEAKTSTLKNFSALSRKQLQTITGGDDPVTPRGTKTSATT
jgi:hypothetical protein